MQIINRIVSNDGNISYIVAINDNEKVTVNRCWYKLGYEIEGDIPQYCDKYEILKYVCDNSPEEDRMTPSVERKAKLGFVGLRDTCCSLKQALEFAKLCLETSNKNSWEYLRVVNGSTVIKDFLV